MNLLNNTSRIDNDFNFVRKFIINQLGDSVYNNWFKNCYLYTDTSGIVFICPNTFIKEWVLSNYFDILEELVYAFGKTKIFQIQINGEIKNDVNQNIIKTEISNVVDYSLPLNKKMTFETFMVGDSNELAFKSAKTIGTNIDLFNQLFIYGQSGFGKTHLLHAIAWDACAKNQKVCYISAEQYMCTFVNAMQHKDSIAFKNSFRDVDVLIIDDMQFIEGKNSTQQELCYTFTHLISQNKRIIIAANKSPAEFCKLDSQLQSRFSSILLANIYPSSYDLRVNILNHKIQQYQKNINSNIISMIANAAHRNIRELEGALLRMCAQMEFFHKEITAHEAQVILSEMFAHPKNKVSIEQICNYIVKFYEIDPHLFLESRMRHVMKARKIAMYLCRDISKQSFPAIGAAFGGKDHTTVMNAIKKVAISYQNDQNLKNEIEKIKFNILNCS